MCALAKLVCQSSPVVNPACVRRRVSGVCQQSLSGLGQPPGELTGAPLETTAACVVCACPSLQLQPQLPLPSYYGEGRPKAGVAVSEWLSDHALYHVTFECLAFFFWLLHLLLLFSASPSFSSSSSFYSPSSSASASSPSSSPSSSSFVSTNCSRPWCCCRA